MCIRDRFGATLAGLGLERREALALHLYAALRGVASAAVRLGLIGPHEAQRLQCRHGATLDAVLADCEAPVSYTHLDVYKRQNFTGPFFMSPWNYPGFYFRGAGPLGPKDWANGRDVGMTVWGNALEAKFKYYAGVYGLDQGLPNSSQPPGANPYYSARVSYTFQGSEPGYFGSSTYYGGKEVFTVGAGCLLYTSRCV